VDTNNRETFLPES